MIKESMIKLALFEGKIDKHCQDLKEFKISLSEKVNSMFDGVDNRIGKIEESNQQTINLVVKPLLVERADKPSKRPANRSRAASYQQ